MAADKTDSVAHEEWERAIKHHKKARKFIDQAIDEIYAAEDFPMCCAENARIYLFDAKEQLAERIVEFRHRQRAQSERLEEHGRR